MEEDFRNGEECPHLLDLIPNERDWMVKEVGGGGKRFGVEEEKKLELRLGLPGGEDWPAPVEKTEEHSVESVLSLGHYKLAKTSGSNPSSVGAKRGFFDTVESKTEGMLVVDKKSYSSVLLLSMVFLTIALFLFLFFFRFSTAATTASWLSPTSG